MRLKACLLLLLTAAPLVRAQKLDEVLTLMDKAATAFKGMQAQIKYTKATVIVDDVDVKEGGIFFQRGKNSKEFQVKIDFRTPDVEQVLIDGRKSQVVIYHPKIQQKDVYEIGKDKDLIEQFLLLGFGGGGHELTKSYDVKLAGVENAAYKLNLTPKGSASQNFQKAELWISQASGQVVQQKFTQASKDWVEIVYTNVSIGPVSDKNVQIVTEGKGKVSVNQHK